MDDITIVTESSSNLPQELVQAYGIHVLPLRVNWNGESLIDGVDISPREFYLRLQSSTTLPTTSSLTPGELLDAVNSLTDGSSAVVAILLANELSSSVEAAEAVQQMAPDKRFYIVDSKTAGMAEGFVALEAARKAADGASVEEVIARANEVAQRAYFLGALETLQYLHRGGRIGAAAYFLGTSLRMRPVVGIMPGSGVVTAIARPRTWRRAVTTMIDIMSKEVGDQPVHVAVSHGNQEEEANHLADALKIRFDVCELYITYFTPVMGAHAGPVLALSFYVE